MNLYLAQHGKALSKETDETRPLSQDGITETKVVAKALKENGISISNIFHSGKLRAAQTAEIFAAILKSPAIKLDLGMKPNDDAAHFAKSLSADNDSALYVGHLPHIQKVVSYLLNNDDQSKSIAFKNSAIVNIEIVDGSASILWYITPSILKK